MIDLLRILSGAARTITVRFVDQDLDATAAATALLSTLLLHTVTQHSTHQAHTTSGCSDLAVACLTAVCEVLGSNRAAGSCVYRTTTAIYSLGHIRDFLLMRYINLRLLTYLLTVCTLPAVPRSTQPSTLRGTVNEYQLSG